MEQVLVTVFLCLGGFVTLLVGGIVWLIRQGRKAQPVTVAPPVQPPAFAAEKSTGLQLRVFDQMVARWASEGRLDQAIAITVRNLLAQEAQQVATAATTPVVPASPAVTRPLPELAVPITPVAPAVPVVPTAPVVPAAPAAPAAQILPAGGGGRTARHSLGAALLALGTRRTLLFLGTFLLIMSSLTLVIFNWSSFAPIVQFGILAGTTAAIWAGGAWMTRHPDLATAGRNLQAVAAMLMPVVGFALGRPGLLDLGPRPAWQLTSALSLGAYIVASLRTRRSFYSGAAALAVASLLMASLGALELAWQLVPLLLLMSALLLLVNRLRTTSYQSLAEGPRWVALVGAPLTMLVAAQLYLMNVPGENAFTVALLAATLFCVLAHWFERQVFWLWAAVALVPAAAQVACRAANSSLAFYALANAGLGLAYFGLGAALERRYRPALAPLFTGALGLGLLALPLISIDQDAARLALPPLIAICVGAVVLIERGRFTWLGARRPGLANASLTAATVLFAAWFGTMLFAWNNSLPLTAMWLLPLVWIYFAAAAAWPGRSNASYAQLLQLVASVVACLAGTIALNDPATALGAALMLSLIFGAQAVVRPWWLWATVSLTTLGLASVFAVQRFVPLNDQFRVMTFVALALSIGYSLGGERVRHSGLRCWTIPAMALGVISGLSAVGSATLQLDTNPGLFTGVFLALAALLGLQTALWRRSELGYPAAVLLVGATMVAATNGFFIGWQRAQGDLGYVICALALGLALLGWVLRRYGRIYALPYEQVAFIILPAAPLLAVTDRAHLTLTWAALTGLYALALWRYRLPWMLGLAFVALDMTLLHGAGWLLPGGNPAGAGLILASAVVAQSLCSAWAKRRAAPLDAAARWGYLSASLGAVGALALAQGSASHSATVAGLLAVLAAVLVWIEGYEALAWTALCLLGLTLAQLHRYLGLTPTWGLLAGCLEALGVYVGGWGVMELAARLPRLAPWRRPLAFGAGSAMLLLPLGLGLWSTTVGQPLVGIALLLLGLGVALVGWRDHLPTLAGVTLTLWVLAVVVEGPARNPLAWNAVGHIVLLGLAWLIGLSALVKRVTQFVLPPRLALTPAVPFHQAIYGATALTGLLAIIQTERATDALTVVLLGLAALAALIATVERAEALAWVSLGLAVVGAGFGHHELGMELPWAVAWVVLELTGVSLVGWLLDRLGVHVWQRPTTLGASGAGLLLTAVVAMMSSITSELPPLTFALASLGLLLATVAVRERELYYAYVAGAAFVGAALCQIANWGVRELQWYVVPAGLYLLALAAGLRRFQGKRRASQLIETAAVVLLLAVTFAQALREDSRSGYSMLLFGEALTVTAYGALARLRVPFVGGIGFFIAGVIWMTVDTVRPANQWVVLGVVGLIMVLAYVILERHQERLVRAGRQWMAQLQSWG